MPSGVGFHTCYGGYVYDMGVVRLFEFVHNAMGYGKKPCHIGGKHRVPVLRLAFLERSFTKRKACVIDYSVNCTGIL